MNPSILYILVLGLCLAFVAASNKRFAKHRRQLNRKIVGGRPALPGEVPFQLSVVENVDYEHFCGASLVNIRGIHIGVTAAHCVRPTEAGHISIVAGALNKSNPSGSEQMQTVVKVVVHEGYDPWRSNNNDIAILFVPELFNITERVDTVPLPARGQLTLNGSLTVSGWGDLEYEEYDYVYEYEDFQYDGSEHLQIVEIPIWDIARCMDFYDLEEDTVVCAGTDKGDLSPCYGDSGGPAISDDGYLAGIVSFGKACGAPGAPGVFTRVSAYIDWITTTVANFKKEKHNTK